MIMIRVDKTGNRLQQVVDMERQTNSTKPQTLNEP
jgi:hypothetical protein